MLFKLVRGFAMFGLCLAVGTANANAQSWFNFLGIKMKLEVPGGQTKGAQSVVRAEFPPGGGPPSAHIHSKEDETFIITRGHFRFWYGKQVVDAMPGSVLFLPRNVPHQYRNVGNTLGEQIIVLSPAGFERFFMEVSKRGLILPKDGALFGHISAAYGIRYVPSLTKPTAQR